MFTFCFVLFSMFPFIPFVIVWMVGSLWIRPKKKVFRLAMDATTVFLIVAISGLYNTLLQSKFGLYWILFFIFAVAGLLGRLQHRKTGQVDIRKLVRVIWRVSFFLLSVLYIFLLLLGLVSYCGNV